MTSPVDPVVAAFEVCGRLPTGVTVLEASAGTGKTFTIAALAARYVAEGTPLEQLLIVTFTRMATGELRDRVRDRLVRAEAGLVRALHGVEPPADDAVLRLLAEGSAAEIDRRRRLLSRALADFDAATIVTTHGFCQHVLSGLGVAGDVDRDVVFVDDLGALVEEVVDDLYVRRFHRGDRVRFGRAEALLIGREAIDHPFAPVEPRSAERDSTPAMRRRLALAVRDEVERRKRAAGVLTYDDLLSRLRDTLADPVNGEAVCERLRARYRVALVDEFQDTDPVQWEILRRAFGPGAGAGDPATLVLIGDPKQAIYAFRGADVYAYLDAAAMAGTQATLDVNWRSDQGLVDAYDALLRGVKLGHPGISYRPVRAADPHQQARLRKAPSSAPLRLRVVERDAERVALTPKGYVSATPGRQLVAADLAADLVELLSSGATIRTAAGDVPERGEAAREERVRPKHVAVLVRTHRQAALVREALDAVGIPAVINGAGSVFGTPVAREWLRLLEALERPTSPPRARSAALTAFIGWTAEEVVNANDAAWEDIHVRLHGWAAVLRRRGVAALLETVTQATALPERLLARKDGERLLTDLRHVGQLLHVAATEDQLGAGALTAWLVARITEASEDTANEERSRRLESDAEAVQVLTIHRSKGLEFPLAYFPYLWEPGYIPDSGPVVFHDPAAGDVRTIDVGLDGPAYDQHRSRYVVELRGEDLRLAYVALTRAKHQAVVWWAGSWDSRNSPLARLLFARDDQGEVAAYLDQPPDDQAVLACFEALAGVAGGTPGSISVETVVPRPAGRWEPGKSDSEPLKAARFERALDRRWRRTSYSAITAAAHEAAHEARVASEAEEPIITDEPELVAAAGALPGVPPVPPESAVADSLLAGMPAGAEIGTFIHGVLEQADFAADDLGAELRRALVREASWRHVDIGDESVVVAGLAAALTTPLGPVMIDAALCRFGRSDRLDELGFEFPLAGGDTPTGGVDVAGIASLLERHLPAGDPLAGYPARLRAPALDRTLRGFLSGSIDLVLRQADPGRFAVVDYKSNWLGPAIADYRPAALAEAMQRAHYPLQALLYTVALHRYLRWRLPGYDPDRHLAGVLYLFLRGMAGPTTPRVDGAPCGVFAWRPPTALVLDLSDLLDQGEGGGMTVIEDAAAVSPDPADVRRAGRAPGSLALFNDAGVLVAADVHVARLVGRLGGEEDDAVLLAAALAARAPRLGHTCIDLALARTTVAVDAEIPVDLESLPWPDPAAWVDRLARSPLVGWGADGREECPLRLVGTRLYLDRYWREERRVAADLGARAAEEATGVDLDLLAGGLTRLFGPPEHAEAPRRLDLSQGSDGQRLAAAVAVLRRFAVVAGGPGTGKTTTVARILALLDEQARAGGRPPPLMALAAPTGKAASRLEESVHAEAAGLAVDDDVRARLLATGASTLHRLLGWRPDSRSRFRHDRGNRLPHDVVVVDETSMVSLSLMARLVEAVRPDARLVLVGDPQQLASVEAGAVLGDIVGPAGSGLRLGPEARARLRRVTGTEVAGTDAPRSHLSHHRSEGGGVGDGIVVMRAVHRYGGGIAQLADAVSSGNPDAAMEVLQAGGVDGDVLWIPVDTTAGVRAEGAGESLAELRSAVVESGRLVTQAARAGDGHGALEALGAFRLLCAHRRGPFGVGEWSARAERWLSAEIGSDSAGWYVGRPLLVTQNDYGLRLFNGDTGVVVAAGPDRLAAVFERRGELLSFAPTRLGAVETVHAMTVHKSQGSQFTTVAVLLPPAESPILTRELLYTAVTRARRRLLLVGPEASVRAAVVNPIARPSGLRELLWGADT